MRTRSTLIIALAATLGLSACASSDLERAGIGAATGAAAAVLLDGNIATGLLVGGAAGALCDDVNICN